MTRSRAARHAQGIERMGHESIVARDPGASASGTHPRRTPAVSGSDQGCPRWCRRGTVRTVVVVDLAPPSLDPAPASDAAPEPPRPTAPGRPDGLIGGVAALLAARLGVDALWIRIGFVLLALVGGVGLLVYFALWLALVRGADRQGPRIAGGVLLIAGLPFVLHESGNRFFSGPIAVLALLAGLAVALWQPRRGATTPVAATAPVVVEPGPDTRPVGPPPTPAAAAVHARAPRRSASPPSWPPPAR